VHGTGAGRRVCLEGRRREGRGVVAEAIEKVPSIGCRQGGYERIPNTVKVDDRSFWG
jgi:hypothetical protein